MNPIFTYLVISAVIVKSREECDFTEKTFSCKGGDSKSLMFDFNSKNNLNTQTENIRFTELNYSAVQNFLIAVEGNLKKSVKSIRIVNCGLEDVSEEIAVNYPGLLILDLSENKIKNLDFLQTLPKQLEELYLRKNRISTILDIFTDLQLLKVIDLSFCNIETVNFMVFKNNQHLSLVNVSHNKVTTCESEIYLKNIECVDLSYNKLEKYTNIPSLCLDFSYTDMTDFHWYNIPDKNKTVDVEKFYFSGNKQLKLLASDIKNETVQIVIRFLNLSYFEGDLSELHLEKINVIKLLSMDHSNIKNLDKYKYDFLPFFIPGGTNATLDLSHCSINDVTGDYFQNYNLGRLNLCYNNLTVLKNGVFKNAYIVQLDLCFSNLQMIENRALSGLYLSALNMSNNQLLNLEFLRQIELVRYVDLSNNYIKVIHRDDLKNLVKLEVINLGNNNIVSISENSFALDNINVINLSNNSLIQIEKGTFFNISRLREVHLQNNYIENIDNNAFKYLPALQIVNLGETSIYGIKIKAFTNVYSSNFNEIYLKHNSVSNLHLVCKLFK